MNVKEAITLATGFAGWSHPEKIKFFGWHLHVHRDMPTFQVPDITRCYEALHLQSPANIHRDVTRLVDKRPADLLKNSKGIRLEASVREFFDTNFGTKQAVIRIAAELEPLRSKISNPDEQVFLEETIKCVRAAAFRAAIVMAWNLGLHHLLQHVLSETTKLGRFNTAYQEVLVKLFGKNGPIENYDDFAEKLNESQMIKIARHAEIINKDLFNLMEEKLKKRNSAAHPSSMVFERPQAEAFIADIIQNVVLKLK